MIKRKNVRDYDRPNACDTDDVARAFSKISEGRPERILMRVAEETAEKVRKIFAQRTNEVASSN